MCRDSIAELEIVRLLLRSLQLSFAPPMFKTQCLITLAACIEECGKVFCKIRYHCEKFITISQLVEHKTITLTIK